MCSAVCVCVCCQCCACIINCKLINWIRKIFCIKNVNANTFACIWLTECYHSTRIITHHIWFCIGWARMYIQAKFGRLNCRRFIHCVAIFTGTTLFHFSHSSIEYRRVCQCILFQYLPHKHSQYMLKSKWIDRAQFCFENPIPHFSVMYTHVYHLYIEYIKYSAFQNASAAIQSINLSLNKWLIWIRTYAYLLPTWIIFDRLIGIFLFFFINNIEFLVIIHFNLTL